MSRRVSHSLLDPTIGPQLKSLYPLLRIPRRFPPEGIVLIGHGFAIAGAIGFAFSTQAWWGGILGCLGVIGNHTADCLDGTHARSTGQCRNGGELLDHFTDPLSFAYILIGLAIGCQQLELGLAALCVLFSLAVLTNIKAKMTGEFTLSAIGPTEMKAALALFGIVLTSITVATSAGSLAMTTLSIAYGSLVLAGVVILLNQLITSIAQVNKCKANVDTAEWVTRDQLKTSQTLHPAMPSSDQVDPASVSQLPLHSN